MADTMEDDSEPRVLKEGEETPEKSSDGDQEFEPTADMLVHDFDDEQTLAEEEAIAIADGEDPQNELNSLQKESDMPIEQLLALYGYGAGGRSGAEGNGSGAGREGGDELPDEEMEEDEDEEEVDEDSEMESTSSSSGVDSSAKGLIKTEAGPEGQEASGDAEDQKPSTGSASVKSEPSTKPPRSDLHLLYEEGPTSGARLLRSAGAGAGATASDEDGDEEEDADYAPGEEEWRKTIMIGSEYQASVPSGLSPYDNAQTVPYENEDKLLWSPWKMEDEPVEEYLSKCAQIHKEVMHSRIAATANSAIQPVQTTLALLASIPMGSHTRDDEQALHQLLQCGYNVEEAMRRRKMSGVTPSDTVSLWSEEECRNFESGLRVFGKDFHHIQSQKVRTRSVGELVQFYYLWKKTERHDVLANRARLEKKKYALHPGTTDYMDRFLDEQEQVAIHLQPALNNNNNNNNSSGQALGGTGTRERSNSRSSSPNVHSLIYGDPKRLRVPPSAATPPAGGGGEDGATAVTPNGLSGDQPAATVVAGDGVAPANNDEGESGNGQVLSAAAAAAAAAAAIQPPPPSQEADASGPTSSSPTAQRDVVS